MGIIGYSKMIRWRSGNAGVCKTSMRGFDSRTDLIDNSYTMRIEVTKSLELSMPADN